MMYVHVVAIFSQKYALQKGLRIVILMLIEDIATFDRECHFENIQ